MKKWFTHFSELLGKVPNISGNEEEEIIHILSELDRDTGPFTGIPPEVFKLCNIDEMYYKVLVVGDNGL